MSVGATILAALKAIPEISKQLGRLGDALHKIGDDRIDAKYEAVKAEVKQLTDQLEHTNDPSKVADLIRDLNSAVSK